MDRGTLLSLEVDSGLADFLDYFGHILALLAVLVVTVGISGKNQINSTSRTIKTNHILLRHCFVSAFQAWNKPGVDTK